MLHLIEMQFHMSCGVVVLKLTKTASNVKWCTGFKWCVNSVTQTYQGHVAPARTLLEGVHHLADLRGQPVCSSHLLHSPVSRHPAYVPSCHAPKHALKEQYVTCTMTGQSCAEVIQYGKDPFEDGLILW